MQWNDLWQGFASHFSDWGEMHRDVALVCLPVQLRMKCTNLWHWCVTESGSGGGSLLMWQQWASSLDKEVLQCGSAISLTRSYSCTHMSTGLDRRFGFYCAVVSESMYCL